MIDFWHNPRCSKSRQALALLNERGAEVRVRLYLQNSPDAAEIRAVQRALGAPPLIEMMRTGEKLFKEQGLSKSDPDELLLAAMDANPILIERPIAIAGDRAVIGRPPEKVLDLL